MRIIKPGTGLLSGLLFFLSSTTLAGVDLGYATGPAKVSDNNSVFKDPAGGYLHVGYMSNYQFGAEFGLTGIGETTGADEYTLVVSNLLGVAKLPLGQYVSVYAKAGMARWHLALNGTEYDDGRSLTYGAGADFNLTSNWSIMLEWQRYTDISILKYDVDHTRLGVRYNF